MTVIPGVPRAPKGNYRPANITPKHTVDHQAITHDPSLTTDPYLHPTYAHAFRRPASPIAEGRFNPSLHATPLIRRKSESRQNTATSGVSRTNSIPLPPPAAPMRRTASPLGHKRHASSGSISTHPSSKGSSPASHPPSILTSPDHSPPDSPTRVTAVKPALPPPQSFASDGELDPVSAIMSGSTRAGKLTKRQRSERTVTSQGSTAPSSPIAAPNPPKTKSRSRFGFLRFGKAAAGRPPPEPFPEAMLPPERQPSTRDIGEPSGRFLSPASSFVVLDGPPSPPPESIGVPLPDVPRLEGDRAPQYRDSPIYGLEGNRYLQGDHAAKMTQANVNNIDRVDGLDTTGPYGLPYHMSGPYDAIGSVVGSQRNSRVVGSPADMRNRHSLLPPSIAGSSVHAGHRTYPGIGSAAPPPLGAAMSSPYPPNVEFIPEALPPGQMQAYSSHSRGGSGGSAGSQNSYGSARGPPVIPHGHAGSAERYSRELVHPGEQYGGYAPADGSAFTDGRASFAHERPASDDFYNGQQARFAAPPEDHSDGQREEGHWDGEHGSDYGNQLYHRRSRDEDVKFVPMRQPIVSPANDVQSHYGHESQVYSEHRSQRSGGGSIMSGSSAGRGSLPSRHQPRSLVMPSPLQGSHSSPPLAPEGSPGGYGYNQRHSRSPAHYSNGRHSRDHSQNRSSMAPSWQSPSMYGQPQAAVISMNTGKGGRLQKK